MTGSRNLDYVIIDLLENTARNIKAHPVNLGGVAGSGGGEGSPPGGFIGWLPQTRVAYDTDEFASSGTASGMSLLDNLNHIRYRLGNLEASSGILVVDDWDGNPTINNVQELTFSGAIVTQLSAGHALVVVSGGGGLDTAAGDARYLKLDATNDPVTGPVSIVVTSFPPADTQALKVVANDPGYAGIALDGESHGNYGLGIITFNYTAGAFDQDIDDGTTHSEPGLILSRYSDAAGAVITGAGLEIDDYPSNIVHSGGTIKHIYDPNGTPITLVDINPYVAPAGTVVLLNSKNVITASGKLVSLKNQGTEEFYVTGSGIVNIPTGATYNINGSPHSHALSYDSAVLSDSGFSITGSDGTFQDTGLSLSLPEAGTYLVDGIIRAIIQAAVGTYIVCKLYNSTDSAYVTNSEVLAVYATTTGIIQNCAALAAPHITVTGAKTIKLYASRNGGGGVYTISSIGSGADGRTLMRYTKIA